MNFKTIRRGLALAAGSLLVTSFLWLAGCVSTSSTSISPDQAALALETGDRIDIDRKDGSTISVRVEEVTETEIVGRNVRVSRDEIDAITLLDTSYDENGTYEAIGWIGALLLWSVIL